MNQKILSFIITCFVTGQLCAQEGPVNIVSPETAGFAKTGNVPVSTYTGVPGISVPLFTITDGPISLPITLSYNASGIKVQEESTWVGLGFSLNTGGQITRAVRGQDDFINLPDYFNYESGAAQQDKPLFNQGEGGTTQQVLHFPPPQLDPVTLQYLPQYVQTRRGPVNYADPNYNPYFFDWTPDMFYYSAGNNSGKFVLDDNGAPMTLKKSNLKVALVNGLDFQITGEDGMIYTYSVRDDNASMGITAPHVTNTWYLTKIQSADGNNVVNFVYGGTTVQTNPITTQKATINTDGSISTINYTNYSNILSAYLTEIDFKGGKLVFQSSANRADVTGERRLDAAILYDPAGNQVSKYSFQYSYFGSGTDLLASGRLKLDAIIVNDDIHQSYTFSYNLDYIPSKSAGTDHWGYFNSAGIGIPEFIYSRPVTLSDRSIISEFVGSGGADYEAHWPYTQAMMLNKITYPTGGYSKFFYEPNEFGNIPDYWKYRLGNDPPITVIDFPVGSIGAAPVQAAQPLTALTDYTLYCHFSPFPASDLINFYIEIDAEDGTFLSLYNLSNFDIQGDNYYLTVPHLGLSGRVKLKVWRQRNNNLPVDKDYFLFFQLNLSQSQSLNYLVPNNYTKVQGGGLRIKKIVNGDGVTENDYREYKYDNADGTTSGVIMNYPVYLSFPTFKQIYSNVYAYFSSTSVVGLSTSASGSYIGYRHVTEYVGSSSASAGSTEYDYATSPDITPWVNGADLPCLQTQENGLLLKKVDFDDQHRIVNEVDYAYNNFDLNWKSTTGVNVFTPDRLYPGQGFPTPGDPPPIYFWRDYQLDYKLLGQSSKTYSASRQDFDFAEKTTSYEYGTNSNPRKVVQSTSTSDMDQTEYRYADDFTGSAVPAFVSEMKNYNLLGKPIEMVHSRVNGSGVQAIGGTAIEYGTGSSRGLVKNQYRLDLASGIPWADGNFSNTLSGNNFQFNPNYQLNTSLSYANGNVIDYSDRKQQSAYIWDYANRYPIAMCINASDNQIAYTSFEADGTGGWTIGSPGRNISNAITGQSSYALNSDVSRIGLSGTTTYTVSYWINNAGTSSFTIPGTLTGYPVKGRTVTINGNAWTYFEHKISGQSSIIIQGSGNIDELRLYPATSQMTTYTYAPLVGMTSQCDLNNRITYYEYDTQGRLQDLKDQDGNIIKTIDYHYKGQ